MEFSILDFMHDCKEVLDDLPLNLSSGGVIGSIPVASLVVAVVKYKEYFAMPESTLSQKSDKKIKKLEMKEFLTGMWMGGGVQAIALSIISIADSILFGNNVTDMICKRLIVTNIIGLLYYSRKLKLLPC